MSDKDNQDGSLTSNQENLIAFLVIGLFGLMYLFFMNGNKEADLDILPTATTSNIVPVTNTATTTAVVKTTKPDDRDRDVENTVQTDPSDATIQALKLDEESRLKTTALEKLAMLKAKSSEAKALSMKALDAEKQKSLTTAQKLADTQKQLDAERQKTEQLAMDLAETKRLQAASLLSTQQQSESDALKIAQQEKAKAEEEARTLAAQAEQIKAESEALKLAIQEKAKSEEEARRLATQAQQDAEAFRLKALAESEKSSREKAETEERIRIAQEALEQQERNQLSFNLSDGRTVRLQPNSFADTLKKSIIDQKTNTPIVLDKVLFSSGSARLNRAAVAQIERTAAVLQAYDNTKVLLRGHTDNTGAQEDNVTLSLNRSLNIKNRLVALGIDASRIQAEGLGAGVPIADNATNKGRRQNRRTDLLIIER